MNSYSKYVQITSDKLIIKFPSDFYRGKALLEITPIPEEKYELKSTNAKRESFKKLLLQRPSNLSKDEINKFQKISEWINGWKPKDY